MTTNQIDIVCIGACIFFLSLLDYCVKVRRTRRIRQLDEEWYLQYKTYKFMLEKGINMPWLTYGLREKVNELDRLLQQERPHDWRDLKARVDQKHE